MAHHISDGREGLHMFHPVLGRRGNRVVYLHRNESWLVGRNGLRAGFPVCSMVVMRGTKSIRAREILRMFIAGERGNIMLILVCGTGHLWRVSTSQGRAHVVVHTGLRGS